MGQVVALAGWVPGGAAACSHGRKGWGAGEHGRLSAIVNGKSASSPGTGIFPSMVLCCFFYVGFLTSSLQAGLGQCKSSDPKGHATDFCRCLSPARLDCSRSGVALFVSAQWPKSILDQEKQPSKRQEHCLVSSWCALLMSQATNRLEGRHVRVLWK